MRIATVIAAGLLTAAATAGLAPAAADTDPTDQQYIDAAQQVGVTFAPEVDIPGVGKSICTQLTSGMASNVNPVPTVRGVISALVASGMTKSQAGGMLKAAVAIYCPEHTNIVGR